ncbi:MAG: hypothetical protein KF734_07500 [Saprospiraceae bacterium]|nr:hypothetical protein [Saprospiraceae bacterium]
MKRIYPRQIKDKFYLSRLLEEYLTTLEESPMQVKLRALAYNSKIPESIFRRLMNLHRNPEDAPNINAEDYHILFSNIMFRYPTVKMWLQDDGEVFFEM